MYFVDGFNNALFLLFTLENTYGFIYLKENMMFMSFFVHLKSLVENDFNQNIIIFYSYNSESIKHSHHSSILVGYLI